MAVSVLASAQYTLGVSTITPTAGSNRMLLVGICNASTEETLTDVTIGGTSLTLVTDGVTNANADNDGGSFSFTTWYYMTEAQITALGGGAKLVDIGAADVLDYPSCYIYELAGVNQSDPFHEVQTTTVDGTGSITMPTLATVAGGVALNCGAVNSGGSSDWDVDPSAQGWTVDLSLYQSAGNDRHGYARIATDGTSLSNVTWDRINGSYATSGVSIKPDTGGGVVNISAVTKALTLTTYAANFAPVTTLGACGAIKFLMFGAIPGGSGTSSDISETAVYTNVKSLSVTTYKATIGQGNAIDYFVYGDTEMKLADPFNFEAQNDVYAMNSFPTSATPFGTGNFFTVIADADRPGEKVLKFDYEGRNNILDQPHTGVISQDNAGGNVTGFVLNGDAQTVTITDTSLIEVGYMCHNVSRGWARYEVVAKTATTVDLVLRGEPVSATNLSGTTTYNNEILTGATPDKLKFWVTNSPGRRVDGDQCIAWLDAKSSVPNNYGETFYHRMYFKIDRGGGTGHHTKLVYHRFEPSDITAMGDLYLLSHADDTQKWVLSCPQGANLDFSKVAEENVWYYTCVKWTINSSFDSQDGEVAAWVRKVDTDTIPTADDNVGANIPDVSGTYNINLLKASQTNKSLALWGNNQTPTGVNRRGHILMKHNIISTTFQGDAEP